MQVKDNTDKNNFKSQVIELIDEIKSVCADAGLGNSGDEYQIITEIFLYKFINDKFIYEIKKIEKKLEKFEDVFDYLSRLKKKDYEILMMRLNENIARLNPDQLISSIYKKQDDPNYSKIFDDTLIGIAKNNDNIFSQLTAGGKKIQIFESIGQYINDNPSAFCKAIINKLIKFSFENFFEQKFDFYASIFEYLIKDYNSNSGGTDYAEYFTPNAVSRIIASCLINKNVKNVTCYDPSAGSGTLLMNLAHEIGENKCSIYSQDISQKSSSFLRLNLILNNLVHSIPNAIQGNTIKDPYHKENNKIKLFDFIVSNPPFKTDFSNYRNDLETKENRPRFFAGIPKIPPKDKKKMEIFLLFIQHIISSLSKNGKAAIVVPSGFLKSKSIGQIIRKYLIENKMLTGVISMPKNIFANTGTRVSIMFIDKESVNDDPIFINATKLGTAVKEGDNEKTVLSLEEESLITSTFKKRLAKENFSIKVSEAEIIKKKYSFSAGDYMLVKIDYSEISKTEFDKKIELSKQKIKELNDDSKKLDAEINKNLEKINYDI
jgi:type I restriction enzyme M protein